MADVNSPITYEWRGRERYSVTWEHQLAVHQQRRSNEIGDRVILVEHEPVITLGRSGDLGNLMVSEQQLEAAGVDFHRVERGGDITYHGPGQLVGYPIINLRERGLSVRDFIRGLEQALINLLKKYGIESGRIPGLTGVWHDNQKLAAIGVAVRGGISYHGFALNVDTELTKFNLIVPCGITDKQVSSISIITGRKYAIDDVRKPCEVEISRVFGN